MESIENYISGLFVSFQSMGEAAGPVMSSWIAEQWGFTASQEAFSALLFTFTIVYFLSCGACSVFQSEALVHEQDIEATKELLKNNNEARVSKTSATNNSPSKPIQAETEEEKAALLRR